MPRTISRLKSFSALHASIDDTLGSSIATNKTIAIHSNESNSHASSVDKETAAESAGLLPSYKQLIIFISTTILIWLSEPLLSLVDTTIVGLTASARSAVVQIAALGPATTLFDSLIYTTYFLAIATTNKLAPGLAAAASSSSAMADKRKPKTNGKDTNIKSVNPWKELRQSTSHLLGLATVFGFIVTAITFVFGRAIIGQMVGGATNMSIADANAIVPLAINYARIRSAVAPFSIVGFVAQSFCLTTLDVATPAIAVAAASIINILGDLALSPRYGIQGAAVATALATVTSCCILLRKVRKTTNQWKTKQHELEQSTAQTEETTMTTAELDSSQNADIKSDITNDTRDIPFCSIPDKASMINLFKVAGPIFFVMISKVACYNVMTVRATSFGIVALASHNIMMRVFFFFACFGDSLSQAAQSFYPQVDKKARGKLIKRLFFIASFIGLFSNEMSRRILSKCGGFLAKDSNIVELLATHARWVGFATLLHPFILLLEGTMLAKRDLFFMVGNYILTSVLHFSYIFSPAASTFAGLWRALFVFQTIRLVQFTSRTLQQSRKTKRDSSVEEDGVPAPPV